MRGEGVPGEQLPLPPTCTPTSSTAPAPTLKPTPKPSAKNALETYTVSLTSLFNKRLDGGGSPSVLVDRKWTGNSAGG